MSETTDDALRRIAAELRGDVKNFPIAALTERLRVPLPPLQYASIEGAPRWVVTRFDGCPKCYGHDNVPVLWAIDGDGLICAYQCGLCRHAWWTGWWVSPEEMAA